MTAFLLVCWSLTFVFICMTAYNMWKKRVCDRAAAWYRSGARGEKPQAVLTYERRWAR